MYKYELIFPLISNFSIIWKKTKTKFLCIFFSSIIKSELNIVKLSFKLFRSNSFFILHLFHRQTIHLILRMVLGNTPEKGDTENSLFIFL